MDFIRVDKMRRGFACNSSSTHSLVLIPDGMELPDDMPVNFGEVEYGWNNFTLTSRESKAAYVASQLLYVAARELGVSAWETVRVDGDSRLRKRGVAWVNATLAEAGVNYTFSVDDPALEYIDHQSLWSWPTQWVGVGVNLEWIKAIFDHFVDNPRTAVLGGNDNGGEHPFEIAHPEVRHFTLSNIWQEGYVARAEPDNVYWTLFSRANGTKVRIRMDAAGDPLLRARAPELVDVKITDHCPYPGTRGLTCLSCYQASMPTGVHAPVENIAQIAAALGKEHVFEVALGGGEPTFHPQLLDIVKLFRDQQIVPNMTTRNWRFIETDDFPEVKSLLGGLAFSIDSVEDMRRVRASQMFREDSLGYAPSPRLTVQVVMGTVSLAELEEILILMTGDRSLGGEDGRWLPVTLLGFKHTGRGESGPAHASAGWTHVARRAARWGLSIDTALAREHQYEIQSAMGALTLHTVEFSEGAFSMYVNGVNMRMSQSSYEIDGAVPFDERWLEHFQSWEPTGVLPGQRR